jgi:hypothetical protein
MTTLSINDSKDRRGKDETNDCSVIAVTHITGECYHDVHGRFQLYGRVGKCGTEPYITRDVLYSYGLGLREVMFLNIKSVYSFEKALANSDYARAPLLVTAKHRHRRGDTSHLLAVLGGEIKDWSRGSKTYVVTKIEAVVFSHFVSIDFDLDKPIHPPQTKLLACVTAEVLARPNRYPLPKRPTPTDLKQAINKYLHYDLNQRVLQRVSFVREASRCQ